VVPEPAPNLGSEPDPIEPWLDLLVWSRLEVTVKYVSVKIKSPETKRVELDRVRVLLSNPNVPFTTKSLFEMLAMTEEEVKLLVAAKTPFDKFTITSEKFKIEVVQPSLVHKNSIGATP